MKIRIIILIGILIIGSFSSISLSEIEITENETINNIYKYTDKDKKIEENEIISNDFLFDKIIKQIMKIACWPSLSICFINNDQMIWSKGYGFYDLENQKPATDKTIYNIASITKSITGTALMQLWEQGYFDLDEDVNNYLPFSLRNPNFPDVPITFRMLLSHSSSLRNTNLYFLWKPYYEGPPFAGYPSPWLEDVLLKGGAKYTSSVWNEVYPPGDYSFYANINFDIIGYLIEIISNESFYEYCINNIFLPLEMFNTSFNLNSFEEELLAIPYSWNSNSQKHDRLENFMIINYPVGGLYSTVDDLSHFVIAYMNDGLYNSFQLLDELTIDIMHKIQPPGNQAGFFYGLGWLFRGRSIWHSITDSPKMFSKIVYLGHSGDMFGIHTQMYMHISKDSCVIFFINLNRNYKEAWNSAELLLEILFLKEKLI